MYLVDDIIIHILDTDTWWRSYTELPQGCVMMKQKGELITGNGGDGVRVDITRDLSVTDSDHGKLLRNTNS